MTSSYMKSPYILVLEDIVDFQQWLCKLLAEIFPDSRVDACGTIKQASRLIKQHAYDLALLDLALPDGDGTDIIRQLQHQSPSTTAIVLTIFDDHPHLFHALCYGAQGYLLKDTDAALLKQQLQQLAAGIPPFSPHITQQLLHYVKQNEQHKQNAQASKPLPLTLREKQVLIHLAQGLRISDIAQLLGLSAYTVNDYVKEIYRKLHIRSRVQAVLIAQQYGLI